MFPYSNPSTNSSTSPFGPRYVFDQSSNPIGEVSASSNGVTTSGAFGALASPLSSSSTFKPQSAPAFGGFSSGFGHRNNPSALVSAPGNGITTFGGFGAFASPLSSTTTTPASVFGIPSPFGCSSAGFGQSSNPNGLSVYGGITTGVIGPTASPLSSTSTMATTSSPAIWGISSGSVTSIQTPSIAAPRTPGFDFCLTPTFSQSTMSLGNNISGSSTFSFRNQSSFSGSITSTQTTATATSSTPGFFGFSSTPAFGIPSTLLGNRSLSGSPTFPFGTQSSFSGSQSRSPTSDGRKRGTRATSYSVTAEVDTASGAQPAGRLFSISAMPVYKDRCHEELRWEDYQLQDRGATVGIPEGHRIVSGQSAPGGQYGDRKVASYIGTFELGDGNVGKLLSISAMPVYQNQSHEELRWDDYQSKNRGGIGNCPNYLHSTSLSNPFSKFSTSSLNPIPSSIPSNAFSWPPTSSSLSGDSIWTTSSNKPSCTTVIAPSFQPNSSPSFSFSGLSSSHTLAPSPSNPFLHQNSSIDSFPAPVFGETQSCSPFFSTPSTTYPFMEKASGALSTTVTQSIATFGRNNSSSFISPPISTAHMSSPPTISSSAAETVSLSGRLPFNTGSGGVGGVTKVGGQITSAQQFTSQRSEAMVQPVCNPFGTLPSMPQMLNDGPRATPSVKYGISCIPVSDKPSPVRSSSLLTTRHLTHRKKRLPILKYQPKSDGQKVAFFADSHVTPSIARGEAPILPRENPRALVLGPAEEQNLNANLENLSFVKHTTVNLYANGDISMEVSAPVADGSLYQKNEGKNSAETIADKGSSISAEKSPTQGYHATQKEDSSVTEYGADVMELMPKLKLPGYYIEPRVEELAVKESSESGFCSHVKNFIIGRQGYGSIKFFGETDLRRLDIGSLIQFNERDVIVYMDENKKPPVGQGLNKPAEIILSNIKCIDKRTGKHYIYGPKVEKYKEMLKKQAAEQGAEFVSYDPVHGEWKFKVQHF